MNGPGGARQILLVDDETALLALLKRHLERSGHGVRIAASAEAALAAIDGSWTPEVLVADVTLPGKSGIELAIELLEQSHSMVCLICSGHPISAAMIPEPLRARTAVLQKPYRPSDLDAAIRELPFASAG